MKFAWYLNQLADKYTMAQQNLTVKKDDKLSYLIGALADGSIYLNPKHYVYRVTYYQKSMYYLLDFIEPLIFKLFHKYGRFYRDNRNQVYFYEITSKAIYQVMIIASEDFKRKGERSVPRWIKYGNQKIQKSFIRGFFDADGSCSIDKQKYDYRIRFGQVEKQIILDVKKILENLGFKMSKLLGPYNYKKNARPYYEIQIHGKNQVQNFYLTIKPNHPDKQLDSTFA